MMSLLINDDVILGGVVNLEVTDVGNLVGKERVAGYVEQHTHRGRIKELSDYLVAIKLFENGNCSRKLNLFGEGGEEGDMTCDLHHAFMTFVITFCYRSHDFCDYIVTGHMTHLFLIGEGKISEH